MPTEHNIDDYIILKNIPEDINAELLFSCLPEGQLRVEFEGTHKRNAYHDIIGLEQDGIDKPITLHLGRASLYNALPEMLFHLVDRFDELDEKKYEEELKAQNDEKEYAKKFFAPIDLLLFKLRLSVRGKIQEYLESDKLLVDIIINDELTEKEKQNRFVQKALPFLPLCRYIRGDETLITLMLRKILEDKHIEINRHGYEDRKERRRFYDETPRYPGAVGDSLNAFYLGDSYVDDVLVYDIHYWHDEECNDQFMGFLKEMEVFRKFLQDYFLAVGAELRFDISTDSDGLCLFDETQSRYQYLNYNTNL